MPTPPERKKKIMHARISIDGEVLMASDAPPDHFHKPQGFSVSLTVEDPADAERKFKALSEGGSVNMPFGKTFFSKGFGMCVDQFGIPWMVNCPAGASDRASAAGRIDRREFASAQQKQPRGQSAAAANPAPHRGGIGLQHEFGGLRLGIHAGRAGRSTARHEIPVPPGVSRRCDRSAPCSAPACRPKGTARRSRRVRRRRARARTGRETGRPVRPGWRGCAPRLSPAEPRERPRQQQGGWLSGSPFASWASSSNTFERIRLSTAGQAARFRHVSAPETPASVKVAIPA